MEWARTAPHGAFRLSEMMLSWSSPVRLMVLWLLRIVDLSHDKITTGPPVLAVLISLSSSFVGTQLVRNVTMNKTVRVALVALLCVGAAACQKKQEVKAPTPMPEQTTQTQTPVSDGKYNPADLDTDACLRQRVVYFDFDKTEIKPEFQQIMACHAKYLQDRPTSHVRLEGNTDERGTREYNLGLGERRGNAVSSALQSAGGSASQLEVISYGKEKPVCREHNEDCWGKNRRVEIVYTAQ
jgi:peptidoglycan-associated lipoprotein